MIKKAQRFLSNLISQTKEGEKISVYRKEIEAEKHCSQSAKDKFSLSCRSVHIKGGGANAGIIKHILSPPGAAGKNGEFFLVEKRLRRMKVFEAEFDLCRSISLISNDGMDIRPLPRILSAIETEEYYSVVMPFYKGPISSYKTMLVMQS